MNNSYQPKLNRVSLQVPRPGQVCDRHIKAIDHQQSYFKRCLRHITYYLGGWILSRRSRNTILSRCVLIKSAGVCLKHIQLSLPVYRCSVAFPLVQRGEQYAYCWVTRKSIVQPNIFSFVGIHYVAVTMLLSRHLSLEVRPDGSHYPCHYLSSDTDYRIILTALVIIIPLSRS